MGTRSVIGVMHGDNCKAVYCHWDGYPSHNGRILQEYYNDSAKVNHLISLGDISSLKPSIGEKHPFSIFETKMSREEYDSLYGDMTTFYGRDRDEPNVQFKTFLNWEEFVRFFDKVGAEYAYIMRDGVWYMSEYSANGAMELRLLETELELDAQQA